MRYPAYQDYKRSGVEWLGDLPEHWQVKRLKYSTTINDETLAETTRPDFEFDYVDISSVDSVNGIVAREPMIFEDSPSRARRIVRNGDTIVSTVRTYLRAIAPIRREHEKVIVSTGFAVVRPRSVVPTFLSYALREFSFVESVVARSVGVSYPAVNASDVGTIPIPLPSPEEQRAIAGFLNRATGKLDGLVAKKRQLIEKLKEKRTALISCVVTRGLPPTAAATAAFDAHPKLKASGIKWLGDIPAHWTMIRFRRMMKRLDQGWSPNASNSPAREDEWGVLKLSAVNKGRFVAEENKALVEVEENIQPLTPEKDDLLISRSNTPELVGDACVIKKDFPRLIIPDLLYRVKLNPAEASADFLCWFLLSRPGRSLIEADARGSSGSMVKLGQGHLCAWVFPQPPLAEQHAIAAFLNKATMKIDQMVEKVEAAIEKLQEYRTALITAAVTGKMDVRDTRSYGNQVHGNH